MKAHELLEAFSYIDDVYLEQAENVGRHRPYLRTVLLAAVISSVFILGCVCAYGADFLGLRELILPGLRYTGEEDRLIISAQGVKDSPEYKAYAEFQSFYDDYVGNELYGDTRTTDMGEKQKALNEIYFCHTDRLYEKLLELSDKYGLKLREEKYENTGIDKLEAYIGLENIIDNESFDASNADFIAYDEGSFRIGGTYSGTVGVDFIRNVKGYFSQGYISLDDSVNIEQYTYVTAQGNELTVLYDGMRSIYYYNGEQAFISLSFMGKPEELYSLADSINFDALGSVCLSVPEARQEKPETDMSERLAYVGTIPEHLFSEGESISIYNGLELTVEALTVSDNVYEAGWRAEQFSNDSFVFLPDGESVKSCAAAGFFDAETGSLPNGVKLLTVELTVKNPEDGSAFDPVGSIDAEAELFPINLIWLRSTDAEHCLYGDPMTNIGSIAHSSPDPVSGQNQYLRVPRGESVHYRLAYALDCYLPEQSAVICLYGTDWETLYLPLIK